MPTYGRNHKAILTSSTLASSAMTSRAIHRHSALASIINVRACHWQRWSRRHKARGQGQRHKKIRNQGQPNRGQTLSRPRTGMFEAKAKDQRPRTQVQVLSKIERRSSEKIFSWSPEKTVFKKIFQALHKLLRTQKIVLSSSRVQANFRGLEAKAKDGSMVRYVQNLRTTYLAPWTVPYQRTVLHFNFWSVPYQRTVPVP